MLHFFSVVKLFTQDFVFVLKILLACGFIVVTLADNFFIWIQFWQRHHALAANVLLSSEKAFGGAPRLQKTREDGKCLTRHDHATCDHRL